MKRIHVIFIGLLLLFGLANLLEMRGKGKIVAFRLEAPVTFLIESKEEVIVCTNRAQTDFYLAPENNPWKLQEILSPKRFYFSNPKYPNTPYCWEVKNKEKKRVFLVIWPRGWSGELKLRF